MSWKGFKKAMERLPHQISSKVSKGSTTQDSEFTYLAAELKKVDLQFKALYSKSSEFRDNVYGMLTFQSNFAEVMADMLGPISNFPEGHGQNSQTNYPCELAESPLRGIADSYKNMVTSILQDMRPKLESFDDNILNPLLEVSGLIKNMYAVIDKRNHKLLDYDRYRATFEKYEAKGFQPGGRSLPDEQAHQKYSALFEEASRQYNYYNNMIKKDLKVVLANRDTLTLIIMERTARIQSEVYNSLYSLLLNAINQTRFIDLNVDVMQEFDELWSFAKRNLDQIAICGNRVGGIKPKTGTRGKIMGTISRKSTKKDFAPSNFESRAPTHGRGSVPNDLNAGSSNLYSPPESASYARNSLPSYDAASNGLNQNHRQEKLESPYSNNGTPRGYSPAVPPPPNPPPMPRKVEYVVALYDYNSGMDGDLVFSANDVIEVLERTESFEDWWTGKLHGKTGVFPSNYVKLQ